MRPVAMSSWPAIVTTRMWPTTLARPKTIVRIGDYNCDGSTGTVDSDGDGFAACEDCDDSNASVNADADEVCDGLDNDCDGEVDGSSATDIITWYADDDEDGYGDADSTLQSCDQPEEYVLDDTDCDDNDDDTNPGAVEVCDGEDNDCDSVIDPSTSVGALTWYPDVDGDGFGDDALAETSCEGYDGALPEDKVEESGDCDDEDPDVPDADEVCDGVDNDCDGELMESSRMVSVNGTPMTMKTGMAM